MLGPRVAQGDLRSLCRALAPFMKNPVPSATMTALLAGISSLASPGERLSCRVLAYRESIPAGLAGGYVALTNGNRALQIELLSDILGWRSLHGVVEADEERARNAVVEGACDLVTVVARALAGELSCEPTLNIGLPLFVDGGVLTGSETDVQAADIVLGSTRALLVLLTPRAEVRSAANVEGYSTDPTASVAAELEVAR